MYALSAAVAASVSVWAHGVVGQRWFVDQLIQVELRPTKPWGDADVTRRLFAVSWHITTAVFLASAVTLFLAGFGLVDSAELLRFIAIIYAASVGVGLLYLSKRPEALKRPFAAMVVASLVAVPVLSWLAQEDM